MILFVHNPVPETAPHSYLPPSLYARFIRLIAHAGEGYGPESIFQACMDLHAERIGHGFHLFSVDKVIHFFILFSFSSS
jgi:adenosine deaminase